MHNHGSQGQKYADVGKHWLNVCRRRQTLVERRQTPGRDSMHNHGSQGTWLEFHRVINADRASMMQSPAGRDWLELRAGTRAHNLGSMGASMMQTSANRAG